MRGVITLLNLFHLLSPEEAIKDNLLCLRLGRSFGLVLLQNLEF